MKLELMYMTTCRICETCCGTGRQSSDMQHSRIPEGDAAEGQGKPLHHARHDALHSAPLCDQCAGVGSVRIERFAELSLEASLISLCVAGCAAGYTGKPLVTAVLLVLVLFASRMVSFRTERYLLTKRRHASRCSTSSSTSAGS
ncbi:hypothetical protein [Paenibacillus sp. CCS19]|uniref:hypothetical protein n=1 Tax=Paenibacillus sp. CCS19 TaxID=3158387 RepID=UPI00295E9101|nr:hypothetical protein [Paenibacillus cellulosilyticus]